MRLPLEAGRKAFGADPNDYASARPAYPEPLYARLVERCGLKPDTTAFEIGPGTGLATRELLALGANPLHAIEPDQRLAEYIRAACPHPALHIHRAPFEDVKLPRARFDLGVAATSFHWLEQIPALAKVRQFLRASGWWAMWWTHFGSDSEPDAFHEATHHLFAGVAASPSHGIEGSPPFALDRDQRVDDLVRAGFVEPEVERWSLTITYSTTRLLSLYRTFSPIQALEDENRSRFLDELARIADIQFGGVVERPIITQLYTARNPR